LPENKQRRALLVVLDGCGIGALPDADQYGDGGSATLPHVAEAVGGIHLGCLRRLGLGNIVPIRGVVPVTAPAAAFGRMAERSAGKDSTTGHWELAGLRLETPLPTFPTGFPPELIAVAEAAMGTRLLGNVAASGTEILNRLGEEHLRTGFPIAYTSADSVFQVAAHMEIVPLPRLYAICEAARAVLRDEWGVGRVIARPFRGRPGGFVRTGDRRDFALPPPRATLLDRLSAAGWPVVTIGKVSELFAARGITSSVHTADNAEGIRSIVASLQKEPRGLIFANLVDFDTCYGHRNDAAGFSAALEAFDRDLPTVLNHLTPDDLFLLTADHGNDPTTPSTDHSREYVPLLASGPGLAGKSLGTRSTFADVAASLEEWFGLGSGTEGGRVFCRWGGGRDA
jgi:phosphopentomutase